MNDVGTAEFWKRRAERERRARLAAENLAETGTRQLYEKQRQLELLHQIACSSNSAESVEKCIRTAIDLFCEYTGWPVGHAYFASGCPASELVSARLWHLDDPGRFAQFRAATEATRFAAGAGLPGRILQTGQSAWISDVFADPNFPRANVLNEAVVHGAFGFPVVVRGDVVAVLEFFSSQIEAPDEALLTLATQAGVQLGRVFERRRSEEIIRTSEAKYRAVIENAPDTIQTIDRDGRILFINRVLSCYDVSSVLGSCIYDYLSEDAANRVRTLVSEVFQQGEMRSYEVPGPAADGTEAWYAATLGPIKTEGKITSAILISSDVTARKKAEAELAFLNNRLIDASRSAGMAEIATGVLHNVGNVLNSVNVSAAIILERLQKSRTAHLTKAAALLRENQDNIGDFLATHPKGRQLPAFFIALAADLSKEQTGLGAEMAELQQNIDHIKQIVAAQQSYAKMAGVTETVAIEDLVEDALKLAAPGLSRHQIEVVRDFKPTRPVETDRHKVLQILVNLINNAKHALDHRAEDRCLKLTVVPSENGGAIVEVCDNGVGIPAENLTRIFGHGFTTKKTGHGFGLHSGANAARELGGSLTARSDGPDLGATFTLILPAAPVLQKMLAA